MQQMKGIEQRDVDNDAAMPSQEQSGGLNTPHPSSAEALMRAQPLNPYKRLEFEPMSFRQIAVLDL